ncbi:GIY-YIG nuclease family protein [Leptolyngbya sp. BL0902]|uniref:GIY-YIG nuclease family protein n=1 Tax=Leptolyngbya sp. BL0902 TaxID=1115757 RepID=UPI0018E806FE|nr:GIY-YIG nuclease family protein [Leptolyngbya sp. BL0902]
MLNNTQEYAQRLLNELLSTPFESCALITREFQHLPPSPGLYAVRHREHQLLYLGKTKKLRERFKGGHKALTWSWLDDYDHREIRISFALLSMIDVIKLGEELEDILIQATKPPYNARYPTRDWR